MDATEGEANAISRWWAVPPLLTGGLVGWLVSKIGPMAMAEATAFSAGVLVLVVRLLWRHHGETWFWPAITAMALAHIIFIAVFPWPRAHHFSQGDLVFIWIDFFVYLGMGFLIDRLNPRPIEGSKPG